MKTRTKKGALADMVDRGYKLSLAKHGQEAPKKWGKRSLNCEKRPKP